ncbi:ribosome hibernation-promoting factor, HPF/YfiA family [Zhouia sp. PK063]|uniref:ribosome hibernation-promoting factor, HPF/YfiA family n=1 Tax=Zhouia sp. PK063 TaxID=3373602 RepID=UPI0037ACD897
MEYIFNYDGVAASEALETYLKEKMSKLDRKYSWMVRAEVFFKNEKKSGENAGKICEIQISAPGPRLFAKSSKENYHAAVSDAVNQLEPQLEKRKAEIKTH